jgi:hypothetical protein
MADLAVLEPLQGLALDRHVSIVAGHYDNKRLECLDHARAGVRMLQEPL